MNTFEPAEEERMRKFKAHEMSKKEVLHHLRTEREAEHRKLIQYGFNWEAICWSSKPAQGPCTDAKACYRRGRKLEGLHSYTNDFLQLSNKSVPSYVLTSPRKDDNAVITYFHRALGCYLYDKWFRPYESNVDFNHFVSQIIVPMDLECRNTKPSAALVDDIADINRAIVRYLNKYRKFAIKCIENRHVEGWMEKHKPFQDSPIREWTQVKHTYVLNPLLIESVIDLRHCVSILSPVHQQVSGQPHEEV